MKKYPERTAPNIMSFEEYWDTPEAQKTDRFWSLYYMVDFLGKQGLCVNEKYRDENDPTKIDFKKFKDCFEENEKEAAKKDPIRIEGN